MDDQQADYDDEFGKVDPQREVRRRLLIPGWAHLLFGALVFAGGLIITLQFAAMTLMLQNRKLENIALVFVGGATTTLGGLVAFAAWNMLHLRRFRLVLGIAYFTTALSIVPCYSVIIYPFGIWALVLLYQPRVREQFDQAVPAATDLPDDR